MNDHKQQAWRQRCSQLEALGLDPYDPQFPADEDRRLQVQAILKEYDVAIGKLIPVPLGWEGNPPLQAITNLADLAAWLNDQWNSTRATEMGGEAYKASAMEQADRAVRNGYRVLTWLGMDEPPERPFPAESLVVAKQQLDALECWVRQKVKAGWMPPKPSESEEAKIINATTGDRRKRAGFPDQFEVNLLVHKYLSQNPGVDIRKVAKAVGFSIGTVQKTEAWRLTVGRRKAAKKPAKKDPMPLTLDMLACIGKEDDMDDVDARIDAEERVWRRLLEEADEQKRAALHGMKADKKREMIEAASKHYADRLTEDRH
jgi:hypothetical protein